MKMRTESWCGYDIRFVEVNGDMKLLILKTRRKQPL